MAPVDNGPHEAASKLPLHDDSTGRPAVSPESGVKTWERQAFEPVLTALAFGFIVLSLTSLLVR